MSTKLPSHSSMKRLKSESKSTFLKFVWKGRTAGHWLITFLIFGVSPFLFSSVLTWSVLGWSDQVALRIEFCSAIGAAIGLFMAFLWVQFSRQELRKHR
jgi:hypothetical protein